MRAVQSTMAQHVRYQTCYTGIFSLWLKLHRGQTHCARSSRQNPAAKCLKFAKSSTLKLNLRNLLKNVSCVRRVCIDNLIIVIQLLYRLVFWFTTACFVTFSYELLVHYASISCKIQGSENRKWNRIFAVDH